MKMKTKNYIIQKSYVIQKYFVKQSVLKNDKLPTNRNARCPTLTHKRNYNKQMNARFQQQILSHYALPHM